MAKVSQSTRIRNWNAAFCCWIHIDQVH